MIIIYIKTKNVSNFFYHHILRLGLSISLTQSKFSVILDVYEYKNLYIMNFGQIQNEVNLVKAVVRFYEKVREK